METIFDVVRQEMGTMGTKLIGNDDENSMPVSWGRE